MLAKLASLFVNNKYKFPVHKRLTRKLGLILSFFTCQADDREDVFVADKVPKILPNDLEIARLELVFRLRRDHLMPPIPTAGPSFPSHPSPSNPHPSHQEKIGSPHVEQTSSADHEHLNRKSWSPTLTASWSRNGQSNANLNDYLFSSNVTSSYETGRKIDPRYVVVERDETDATKGSRKEGSSSRRRLMTKFHFNVTCSASISNVHHTNETKEFRVASRVEQVELNRKHDDGSSMNMVSDQRDTVYVGSSYFASEDLYWYITDFELILT